MYSTGFGTSLATVFLTRRHARVRGIWEGYLADIWTKFGGHLDEFWRKNARSVEENKRRLEVKNLLFLNLMFLYPS